MQTLAENLWVSPRMSPGHRRGGSPSAFTAAAKSDETQGLFAHPDFTHGCRQQPLLCPSLRVPMCTKRTRQHVDCLPVLSRPLLSALLWAEKREHPCCAGLGWSRDRKVWTEPASVRTPYLDQPLLYSNHSPHPAVTPCATVGTCVLAGLLAYGGIAACAAGNHRDLALAVSLPCTPGAHACRARADAGSQQATERVP